MSIRIVLVGTTHPGNIGAVARAMKNMGLADLTLVNPKIFPDAEATARASGADDVLENATVVDSLEEAIKDCVEFFEIENFNTTIQIHNNGKLTVTEDIDVVISGERRGIFRDIPDDGITLSNFYVTDENDTPRTFTEDYFYEGKRIRIGDEWAVGTNKISCTRLAVVAMTSVTAVGVVQLLAPGSVPVLCVGDCKRCKRDRTQDAAVESQICGKPFLHRDLPTSAAA